jgi:uncharacterized RmlC-like cupin family protein
MADMKADKEKPTCRRVRAGEEVAGKLGHLLAPGTSAQSAGAQRTCVDVVARADPNEQESVDLLPEFETGPIGSLPIYRPFVSDRPKTRS